MSLFSRPDDAIEVAEGKHKGQLVSNIAQSKPDYLEWMRRGNFFEDTKAIVAEALGHKTHEVDDR
jgi:DNA polymerase-3 subunit epsilon